MKYSVNLALWVCVITCSCIPRVQTSTIHPDSDKTIAFDVTRGRVRGSINEMQLDVAGTIVATQPGESLHYEGGPYAPYSNMRLNYKGIAVKSGGSRSTYTGWLYVANPKNVFAYTRASGSNQGYPQGTNEQTGANLYRLDKAIVRTRAMEALQEYANFTGLSLFEISNVADHMVAAVAFYVDGHMSWRSDAQNEQVFADNGWDSYEPGWDFPQPADLTLTISGNLTNASPNDDYQGDCEDHAILRAALLRSLGFAPWAIWDAIDDPITHEYNVVLYEGAYRLMDYGRIERWLDSHTWSSHQSYYGWNEDHGPRGANTTTHDFLVNNTDNYPGGKACPANWSFQVYYRSTCP